jgi:hypothetical protein
MVGGPPRATWHTTEDDPHQKSALQVAEYLRSVDYCSHIVWNPVSGDVVQMIPADRAARALRNEDGGVQTNRHGQVNIQVEVVGRAAQPFTDGPMVGRHAVVEWLRSHGIPDVWPAGQPLAYGPDERRPGVNPAAYGKANGTRDSWHAGGHFGHSQVPENHHGDPGRIDVHKLLSAPQEDAMPEPRDVWDVPLGVTVGGETREDRASRYLVWTDQRVRQVLAEVVAQRRTLDTMVSLLAKGDAVTADELRTVLRKELANAVIAVEVTVRDKETA